MCKCRRRAGRSTRVIIISLAAAAAGLWGAAAWLWAAGASQDAFGMARSAAGSCTVGLFLAVAVGVARKRDHISADAAAAEHEAELAANRAERAMLLEVLRNATQDIALLPPVAEDKRATRPYRIVRQPGA